MSELLNPETALDKEVGAVFVFIEPYNVQYWRPGVKTKVSLHKNRPIWSELHGKVCIIVDSEEGDDGMWIDYWASPVTDMSVVRKMPAGYFVNLYEWVNCAPWVQRLALNGQVNF